VHHSITKTHKNGTNARSTDILSRADIIMDRFVMSQKLIKSGVQCALPFFSA